MAGPTGLIETTTRLSVHPENETRLLSVPVDESPEQTRRVLARIGMGWQAVDPARWHALDRWIALGPRAVVIPFEKEIGHLAKPVATRVRRDLTTLLGLVRAHALLHEGRRELDPEGRVVATLEDYRAVHALTADLFAASAELTVSDSLRDVVEATAAIITEKADRSAPDATATSAELAARLRRPRRSVNRWVQAALNGEYLEDVNPKRSATSPFRLSMGPRALPDSGATVFPTAAEIERARERAVSQGGGQVDQVAQLGGV